MANGLAQRLTEMMKPWLTGYRAFLGKSLRTIVEQLNLDAEMQRQTEHYHVSTWKLCHAYPARGRPVPLHQTFDRGLMESLDGNSSSSKRQHEVSLVVSPALIKTGSTEGEGYQLRFAIVKAQVIAVQRTAP